MTTVVNSPGNASGDSAGVGMIIGILLAIVIVILFFVYGLPAMRGSATPQSDNLNIDVQVPTGDSNGSSSTDGAAAPGRVGY